MNIIHAVKETVTIKLSIAILTTATHSNNIATRNLGQASYLIKNGGSFEDVRQLIKKANGHAHRGESLYKLATKIHKIPSK